MNLILVLAFYLAYSEGTDKETVWYLIVSIPDLCTLNTYLLKSLIMKQTT